MTPILELISMMILLILSLSIASDISSERANPLYHHAFGGKLSTGRSQQRSRSLTTKGLSSGCSSALQVMMNHINSSNIDCIEEINSVFSNSSHLFTCIQGVGGVDCLNALEVIKTAHNGTTASVFQPTVVQPKSSCPLCSVVTGLRPSCRSLLTATVDALYGDFGTGSSALRLKNASDPYIESSVTWPESVVENVKSGCSSTSSYDSIYLVMLRYQSEVLCAGSASFGYDITDVGTISGVLDMRAKTQCGVCAVIPCLPGQYCPADGSVAMCPPGYYCPTPAEKVKCGKGYFCPKGSTEAIKCRSVAGGSCYEGSAREVIWIPLFIALLFLGIIVTLLHVRQASPRWMINARGLLRGGAKIIHDSSKQQFSISDLGISVSKRHHSYGTKLNIRLSFDHLVMQTGPTLRINDLSGEVQPGRFTAILGGSGAGKTSLMNCLLGREAKTSGEIVYSAININSGGDGSSNGGVGSGGVGSGGEERLSNDLLQRLVAFVPQNDVFLRSMTVSQLLFHSARTRLPAYFSEVEIAQVVDVVMSHLGLKHLSNVVVGGEADSNGGLSAGDRKMVNIAIELVALPSVLFMDEPTSSIDASSAMNVASIAHELARSGLTVVAVIHQPRGEIYRLIDDLILLVPGGRMAYYGPARYCMQWFKKWGFAPADSRANKTDFLLDVTSGNISSIDGHTDSRGVDWSAKWDEHGAVFVEACIADDRVRGIVDIYAAFSRRSSFASQQGGGGAGEQTEVHKQPHNNNNYDHAQHDTAAQQQQHHFQVEERSAADAEHFQQVHHRHHQGGVGDIDGEAAAVAAAAAAAVTTASKQSSSQNAPVASSTVQPNSRSFLQQIALFCYRAFLQRIKGKDATGYLLVHLIGGTIMGIVTCGGDMLILPVPPTYYNSCPPGAEAKCTLWLRFETGPACLLMGMVLGAITIPTAVNVFGREREVFAREAAVGVNGPAYFLGKVLADVPFLIMASFLFVAPLVAIAPWRSPVDKLYAVLLIYVAFVNAFGYVLSFLFKSPDDATLVGVILAIILNLLDGFVPKLGDKPIGPLFYTYHFSRAIAAVELYYGQNIRDVDTFNSIVTAGWKDPNWSKDVWILAIIAMGTTALAYVLFLITNRKYVRIC